MNSSSIINFISGHLDLSHDEFNEHYRPVIDIAIEQNQSFVVGDARGADTLAQQYLKGKTTAVTVYHMFSDPRNNVGFNTKGGFQSDNERDKQMTLDSTQDIAWVRPGREKSGTQRNLARRIRSQQKEASE
ncbi:hypothetical protein BTA51_17775 [Hahella sp. CCB-MM4]|uniref:hypothetical protein n=1 Tax=Hahella sp. (strain CCB-MM4) TaxID=1926491 RepID=UPI000B9A622F|nr:hypothetical protein [Hahella sp. CCB-MM4]OZG72196.1 hypothetical protein BTA51_17775 [Hahella sp. CCB-MM4]